MDNLLASDVDLFIIADSSTNDIEEQRRIIENGKDMIILDHHEKIGEEFVEGIVLVNNQLEENPHSNLSGVGVVAMFLKACGYDISKYMDLIAVGLIADVMDMTDLENAYFSNEGLKNVNNSLISECFKDVKTPIIETVSYECANKINAIVREGSFEEKEIMWKAITNQEGTVEYKKRNGDIVNQNYAEAFVRLAGNCKSRQNSAVKKAMVEFEKIIHKYNYQNDKVIILKNDDILKHSLCGLLAQKLMSKYNRGVMILSPYKGEMSGSVRSPFALREELENCDLVTFASGHSQAFGIGLPKENIDKLRKWININLKDVEVGTTTYEVDYVFNAEEVKLDTVKEIANLSSLWRKGIEAPTFIIKNITIESKDIKYGKVGFSYCTSFKYKNMTYKKAFSSKEFYENFTLKNELKFGRSHLIDLTLLVKFKKDNNGFYYIEILDFNVCKSSKVIF